MSIADLRNKKLGHLITVVSAKQARTQLEVTLCNEAELREIGLITIRFSEMEESLALYTEVLMVRPEMGGFLHQKSVLLQHFTEKLEQYKKMSVALGTMYSIELKSVEESIGSATVVAEERHAIVHGYLRLKTGEVGGAFYNKQRETPASLEALATLTRRLVGVHRELLDAFAAFYVTLTSTAPKDLEIEAAAKNVLKSDQRLRDSTATLNISRANSLALEHELELAKDKAQKSKAQWLQSRLDLVAAKNAWRVGLAKKRRDEATRTRASRRAQATDRA